MGKLIFPVKEMAEAPQDGSKYVRKDGAWIQQDNINFQAGIPYPATGWTTGAVWFENTIDLTPYSLTIGATDSWSLIPNPTTQEQADAVSDAGVVKLDLDDSSTIRIYATVANEVAFNVDLEIIRDNGGA